MSDYLTTLPMELIHKILDDVPTLDIFSSVCLVNKHLRFVSLAYPNFQPDFSCRAISMNKNQFDCICTQLHYSISQIVSLTLFDKDDPMTPVKNALFFSRFNCMDSIFSKLRSLTLTYINDDTWRLFKTRLPAFIVNLSIHLVYVGECADSLMTSNILSELLFFSSSLERLSIKMSNYSDDMVIIRPSSSALLSSAQYFHLENIKINLSSLFAVVPMLHTLEISFQGENLTFGNIHPRPLYLQRLRIELWFIRWMEMVILISSFPRLNYLTVIADDLNSDMADGFAWARLLKHIKHFEFKLRFFRNAFNQQPINLDSFRTKFWLEEKKWFVTYNENLRTGSTMLCSNPSSIDEYLSDEMIGILVVESNGLKSTSFPCMHCMTINYQYAKYALLHHGAHIKNQDLLVSIKFPLAFKYLTGYLNTSQIIICHVNSEWITKSPYQIVENLRNLSCLCALSVTVSVLNYLFLHQWPKIIYLRIENDFEDDFQLLSSNGINALCCSFTHIKRLDIHSATVTDLPQLLNRMKMKLTDIIIRQPLAVYNEQFITREWIERNTELEHFHYACDEMNTVNIWL